MITTLNNAALLAQVSNSADTFVCNHLLYGMLHHIAVNKLKTRAGFIHVPFFLEQVIRSGAVASMSLVLMVEATKVAIMATIKRKQDVCAVDGAPD